MVALVIKEDEVTDALVRIGAALDDPLPLMTDLADYLVRSTKARFPTGRAPDGSVWAAKSPVTIAAQGGRGTNRLDTRPLFGPSGRLSGQIFAEAFSHSVEWGSPLPYAAMQQFGGSKSAFPHLWGDIPARVYLGLSDEDETAVIALAEDWLEGAATGGA